jgi:hypothetical protein
MSRAFPTQAGFSGVLVQYQNVLAESQRLKVPILQNFKDLTVGSFNFAVGIDYAKAYILSQANQNVIAYAAAIGAPYPYG